MKIFQRWLLLFCAVFLAACSQKMVKTAELTSTHENQVSAKEQLGTRWGDEISSPVNEVDLQRLSEIPVAEAQIRYAHKSFTGRNINRIALAAGQVSFSVETDQSKLLPLTRDGQQYYLYAKDGQNYQLHYENHSDQTFEVVASVDGLDVINGQAASRNHHGYVLYPHQSLVIEGFRKSDSAVAAFTFSKPEQSYAANSRGGDIRNAGVIGTVLYQLNNPTKSTTPPSQYAPPPNAFPADSSR